jgi:methionine-rich copper-binding protein CopC
MDRQWKTDIRKQGSKPHHLVWWQLIGGLLLSAGMWLFVPQTSFAQADLQASSPKAGALLRVAPWQVHLWMSERLSPMLGRVIVVNERNQEVEVGASLVVGKGARELVVGLPPSLPPGGYVVAWYAVSEGDGQVTDGTFRFTLLLPDGRMPSLQSATIPGFTAASRSSSVDLFDGSTLLLSATLAPGGLGRSGTLFRHAVSHVFPLDSFWDRAHDRDRSTSGNQAYATMERVVHHQLWGRVREQNAAGRGAPVDEWDRDEMAAP